MADTGWVTLTGHGSALLAGGSNVTVLDFNTEILSVTSPRVRVPVNDLGARYQYAGSWGLSQKLNDHTLTAVNQVVFAHPINYKLESNTYLMNIVADRYWWILPSGISVGIYIDW